MMNCNRPHPRGITATLLAALSFAVLALSACTSSVDSKYGHISSIVWNERDSVYYVREPVSDGYGTLWTRARGGDEERIDIPQPPGCARNDVRSVFALGPARLGLMQYCGVGESLIYSAFNSKTGVVTAVARLSVWPNSVIWTEDGTKGYAVVCDEVYPFDLASSGGVVVGSTSTWEDGDRCLSEARIRSPSMLDDLRRLVFLHSLDAVGLGGGRNFNSHWTIVSRDVDSGQEVSLVDGIVDALGMAVSATGDALAFCGSRDGRRGVWAVPEGAKEPQVVREGDCTAVAMSPDGRAVAAVIEKELEFENL